MKKLFLVGNCFESKNNGPANVIKNLIRELEKADIPFEKVLVSESVSKKDVLLKLVNILFKERNTVVNVHTDGLILPFVVYCISLIDRKNQYYLTVHGSYLIESSFGRTPEKKYLVLERVIYKNFSNMICVSEMQKQDLVRIYNRTKPTYVIPNATDAMEYVTEKKELRTPPTLLMLGGIRSEKGIWHTLDFIHYLCSVRDMDINLDVYGGIESTDAKEEFERRVKLLGLEKRVSYQGMISQKEVMYAIIENADFQLCLSNYDSFNVAILESLVLGCPCICSDKCGASFYVKNNGGGVVIDTSNEKWMSWGADYIANLLGNPDAYRKETQAFNKLGMDFSWKKICELYISYIGLKE